MPNEHPVLINLLFTITQQVLTLIFSFLENRACEKEKNCTTITSFPWFVLLSNIPLYLSTNQHVRNHLVMVKKLFGTLITKVIFSVNILFCRPKQMAWFFISSCIWSLFWWYILYLTVLTAKIMGNRSNLFQSNARVCCLN